MQLSAKDFDHIGLTMPRLLQSLDRFIDGRVPFHDFADWSHRLNRIHAVPAYRDSARFDEGVQDALSLLTVFTDVGITEGSVRSRQLVGDLKLALERRLKFSCEVYLRRLYRGKSRVSLVAIESLQGDCLVGDCSLDDCSQGAAWGAPAMAGTPRLRERLAIPASHRIPADAATEPAYWLVPLQVYTRTWWRQNAVAASWAHPENDKMNKLRERIPNLDLAHLEPQYFVSPRGAAEIVVNTPAIDVDALQTAARLFSLRNRLRRTYLNGELIYTCMEAS